MNSISRNTMGEIWSIYAIPDYWGLGVGLALWDAARDGLQEEGCLNVTVWAPVKTVAFGTAKIEEIHLKRDLDQEQQRSCCALLLQI